MFSSVRQNISVGGYVPRGDPASEAYDFIIGNLTLNGSWQDINFSAFVPAGAKAVYLHIIVVSGSLGRYLKFRKKGSVSNYAINVVRTQVATNVSEAEIILALDTNLKAQYLANAGELTTINIIGLGWFL